jgi:putative selenate reductase molybdopterin-binding subunit
VRVPHHRTLLLALREDLGLTGTKKSCNLGQCGACTVLMDGLPVYSCLMLAMDAAGRDLLTVEGLEKNGALHPVQEGFIEKMGSQCGHCTPGMIMSGVGLLLQNPAPNADDVKAALSGNLCRCGNYPHEIESVLAGAAISRSSTGQTPVSPPVEFGASQLNSDIKTIDSAAKATGRARYAGDIGFHSDDPFKSPLVAKVVRSPFPHAEVINIDDGPARGLSGYRGMVTFHDVPGYQAGAKREPGASDRSFLNDKARYVGDAIAAIAADDIYTAHKALELVRVDYNRLEAYPDAERNLQNHLTAIHPGTVAGFGGPQPFDQPTIEFKVGDTSAGFKEADRIIEGRYVTQVQCHVPIETHCCTALWEGDNLTLWDSQQSVHRARDVLAHALRIPPENVRVICEYLGALRRKVYGQSGQDAIRQSRAARKEDRAASRLEYTLKEEMFAEDTRNPFVFYLKTGSRTTTRSQHWNAKRFNTRTHASSGPAVVSVAGEGIIDTYRTKNYWYHGYSVYTNSPVGGEFRGFGHPQAVFARETHIDQVAEAIGMNPLDFRIRNSLRTGDKILLGVAADVPLGNIGVEECLNRGADAIGWKRWEHPSKKTGRLRRGLGMRMSQEHTGRDASDGLVWKDRAGKVHVPIGSGNLGNGVQTAIALIVAETLAIPLTELDVTWADSSNSAWDYVSDASRAVHCHGKAMYNAALDLRAKMLKASPQSPDDLTPHYDPKLDINPILNEDTGSVEQHPAPKLSQSTIALARKAIDEGGIVGLGYYVYNPGAQGWGASFAEVEVDMETGQVRVLKLVGAHDVGRVIHRPGAEAQIHGGGIMGLGYAMTEELITDPHNGIPVNQSLYEYRPPSILDIPELQPILVEAPVEAGPYGAKGLGENPIFDAAAAVANAIYNATGVHVGELPFTWQRVYDALKRSGKLLQ